MRASSPKRACFSARILFFILSLLTVSLVLATEDATSLEPGSLRLSHTVSLEGVFHAPFHNENIISDGVDKSFQNDGQGNSAWKSEWGQSLLSEVETQLTRDISARALFNVQGEYADRFWRPINYDHYESNRGNHVYLKQAEGKIDKESWYLHGFSGVAHNGWADKGDLFEFYNGVYPDRDYLGSSGFFGIYPRDWQSNHYMNISKRRVPQGAELGAAWNNFDAAVAHGTELEWGSMHNTVGRVAGGVGDGRISFLVRDADIPYPLLNDPDDDKRIHGYQLTYVRPSEEGWDFNVGALYQPYRLDDSYLSAEKADNGSGLLGSSYSISTKTVGTSDALGAKMIVDGNINIREHAIKTRINIERTGAVAGNKEEAGIRLGADFGSTVQGFVNYIYRRPVEGPMPFLYEGTPDNILAVAANPRGPESPFTVDWVNREASFLITTINFDPTPGTSLYLYDPTSIALWNKNPDEDSRFAFSIQHRMSDYKTTTDRYYYIDRSGRYFWEPAAHSGAWASHHPLHEVRFLGQGRENAWKWTLGVAGGQSPAISGLAYSTSTASNKPITEYISVEAKIETGRFATWAHYGTGVWGPEENIDPFFGFTYDRIFGLGVRYNISRQTTWDINYLGTRQEDDLFRPGKLGSFDEIRTVLSHRFGFLLLFENPARAGTIGH